MTTSNTPAAPDFDDALDDVLTAPVGPRAPLVTAEKIAQVEGFTEACKKCRGSGTFYSYTGRPVGPCHACKGKGRLTFKTAPEVRQAAQERTKAKATEKAAERSAEIAAWRDAHPAEWAWIQANDGRFDFATSMVNALSEWGHLTAGQLGAVQKMVAKDAERAVEKAAREAAAPAITVEAIETAFKAAQAKGVKRPKLRLDVFTFSLAPATGKNAGSIYVTEKGEKTFNHQTGFETANLYLGKVTAGRFIATRECGPEREARIIAAAADPAAAAVAYGRRTGECSVCGRALTVGLSIDRGIGPICFERMGW